MVLGLAKHPLVEAHDLSSLQSIMSGAAPLGGELAEEAPAGSVAPSSRATA
jgi:4-coumarate--CoA ligase